MELKYDPEQLFKIVKIWIESIQEKEPSIHGYIFGSSIVEEGIRFDIEKDSDVDIVLVLTETYESPLKRVNLFSWLKTKKMELELSLLKDFQKKDNKQIVSLLPISIFELENNIHKAGFRTFFEENDFYDLQQNKRIKFSELYTFVKGISEPVYNVLKSMQEARHKFLQVTCTLDLDKLKWVENDEQFPKALSRNASQIAKLESTDINDRLNPSFGNILLVNELNALIEENEAYKDLFYLLEARKGSKSNIADKTIKGEQHMLLYEILYNSTFEKLEFLKKLEENAEGLVFTREHKAFLEDTDLLSKGHEDRETLHLSDIFVSPELSAITSISSGPPKRITSEKIVDHICDNKKVLIEGENQSGKTTLCKVAILDTFENGLIPIYINDKISRFRGRIIAKIETAFSEQYINGDFEAIDKSKIVIILDDFHYAIRRKTIVEACDAYGHIVLVTDDIFSVNYNEEASLGYFEVLTIRSFRPSFRYKLIQKWVELGEFDSSGILYDQEVEKSIQEKTESVNSALGKVIGAGIMPSFPFYILSVLSTLDADKPLDTEITSQGYCYQALIVAFLHKRGVKKKHIDAYLTFLSAFAFKIYDSPTSDLTSDQFEEDFKPFFDENYNRPLGYQEMMGKLESNILKVDSLGNYSFHHPYLYYLVVGLYFASNIEVSKEKIDHILNNLHKNEFAYIAVFISHHSKEDYLSLKILEVANEILKDGKEATLNKEELAFFDSRLKHIIQDVLPASNSAVSEQRNKTLQERDREEEKMEAEERNKDSEDDEMDPFEGEIRRTFKTVEVMGRIIKNRPTSILKKPLNEIFRSGMNLHRRTLKAFVEAIKDESAEETFFDFIKPRLDDLMEEKEGEGATMSTEEEKKFARLIFWNSNFHAISGILMKIVRSLGSDQLIRVSRDVTSEYDCPATKLVHQGILLFHKKTVKVDEIIKLMNDDDFPPTATAILKHFVINHAKTYPIAYADKQKLSASLGIELQQLNQLPENKD